MKKTKVLAVFAALAAFTCAAGCNLGIGREPDEGVTTLDIPKPELPSGDILKFAVRPVSSLGTSGRPIITDFKV